MKLMKTTLCATAATLAMAGAASAADFSFNAGVASDYVFRGQDQSPFSETQIFAGADVTEGSLYGGAWVSNTGSNTLGGEGVEYDIYAGWKPSLAGFSLDLGAIYYGYTNSPTTADDNATVEFKAAASIPVGGVTLGGAVYYSPDLLDSDEESWYYEANAAYTFGNGVILSAAYGQFKSDFFGAVDSYDTYNVGVTIPVTEKLSFDVRYIGTDEDADALMGPLAIDGFVGTLKVAF